MISAKIPTTPVLDKPDGNMVINNLLLGEVEGLHMVYYYIKGEIGINETTQSDFYDVLLSLSGEALLKVGEKQYDFGPLAIVRIPYEEPYKVKIKKGGNFSFIRLRKSLNKDDRQLISQNRESHSLIYIKTIADCPVYSEDIKSSKTLNRMLLPVGLIPRFCMGSVKTEGPDEVGGHEHAMLDQLFLGLEGCKCSCVADGEQILLTENMMLHIPLGSQHSVSVESGDTLSYIWLDFFLTLEGQKYMDEQHQINDK